MHQPNLNKSKFNKYFIPYDIYERHRKVGEYINKNDTVLDVGGELNHLSQFCLPKKIVVANLTSGDVVIKKDKLPFKNNSFSCVCAIDVLEHIPTQKRQQFIENLIMVASSKVILSFPMGTTKHESYEKETLNWLIKKKQNVAYLREHIKYILPSIVDINSLFKGYNKEIFYSGNITINKYLFRFFMFDPKIKFLRQLIYQFKKNLYFVTNPLLYRILSHKIFSVSINRAYIIIHKNKK